jgi:hypothetical protein
MKHQQIANPKQHNQKHYRPDWPKSSNTVDSKHITTIPP